MFKEELKIKVKKPENSGKNGKTSAIILKARHVHFAKFSYASISTFERVICYDFRTTFAPANAGFIYQPKIQIIT